MDPFGTVYRILKISPETIGFHLSYQQAMKYSIKMPLKRS